MKAVDEIGRKLFNGKLFTRILTLTYLYAHKTLGFFCSIHEVKLLKELKLSENKLKQTGGQSEWTGVENNIQGHIIRVLTIHVENISNLENHIAYFKGTHRSTRDNTARICVGFFSGGRS